MQVGRMPVPLSAPGPCPNNDSPSGSALLQALVQTGISNEVGGFAELRVRKGVKQQAPHSTAPT
jgi:hypothetical protein